MNYDSSEPLDAVRKHNQQAWDRMARSGHKLTNPATRQEMDNALRVIDASGWLPGGIRGWKVLCLAAGGGRHGPLYAAAGAQVTVVDLSPAMLELDREVAAEFGVQVQTIQTSMDELGMLPSGVFDLVVQPVSSCYIPSVARMFPEIARVTKAKGLYISQHKQPANLQSSLETYTGHYVIEHAYYDRSSVPPARRRITCASRARKSSFTAGAICWAVSADRALRLKMLLNRTMVKPIRCQAVSGTDVISWRRMCASKRGDWVKPEPRS